MPCQIKGQATACSTCEGCNYCNGCDSGQGSYTGGCTGCNTTCNRCNTCNTCNTSCNTSCLSKCNTCQGGCQKNQSYCIIGSQTPNQNWTFGACISSGEIIGWAPNNKSSFTLSDWNDAIAQINATINRGKGSTRSSLSYYNPDDFFEASEFNRVSNKVNCGTTVVPNQIIRGTYFDSLETAIQNFAYERTQCDSCNTSKCNTTCNVCNTCDNCNSCNNSCEVTCNTCQGGCQTSQSGTCTRCVRCNSSCNRKCNSCDGV